MRPCIVAFSLWPHNTNELDKHSLCAKFVHVLVCISQHIQAGGSHSKGPLKKKAKTAPGSSKFKNTDTAVI